MLTVEVPNEELGEWLKELKPYQRSTLEEFLKDGSPTDAAEKWLAATGSPNIVPFGGAGNSKPFWDRFKSEFWKFICDDSAYAEEKMQLANEGGNIKIMLIGTISAAVGATLGLSATLLVPAVLILLHTVGKMGKNAYCAAGA